MPTTTMARTVVPQGLGAALAATTTHRLLRTTLAVAVAAWVVGLVMVLSGAVRRPAPTVTGPPPAVEAAAELALVAWAEEDGLWTSAVAVVATTAGERGHEVELVARLHPADGSQPTTTRVVVPVADGPDGPVPGTPRTADG